MTLIEEVQAVSEAIASKAEITLNRRKCQTCGTLMTSQSQANESCPAKRGWTHIVYIIEYRALPCGCCDVAVNR